MPARPPCGLHHSGRRRSRVERETPKPSRERRRTRGNRSAGPGSPGSLHPPRPTRRRRPPPPAPLTRTLQVVAGLHGGSLSRLWPPGPPPPPFRAAAARASARLGPIGPGRGSLRRRRPAPARTAGGRDGGERAGGARASRWRRLLRGSPRLPEGRAGAGAGRGVAEPGARAGGQPPRLAAGPTPPRPPALRHPPSPGFCEVALTWRSLRGGRSAPAPVAARSPPAPAKVAPGSAKAGGALVFLSAGPRGSRPFAGRVPPALAGISEERRGRKRPGPTRCRRAPGPPGLRVQGARALAARAPHGGGVGSFVWGAGAGGVKTVKYGRENPVLRTLSRIFITFFFSNVIRCTTLKHCGGLKKKNYNLSYKTEGITLNLGESIQPQRTQYMQIGRAHV